MGSTWVADELVQNRSENASKYRRNFLKEVVLEFRFPTMLEFGERRPPAAFVAALRKDYPTVDLQRQLTLTLAGESAGSVNKHVFLSKKPGWTVSLTESSFSIETSRYQGYADLKSRAMHVFGIASKIVDSDFFTRVGLRYVNKIVDGTRPEKAGGWVNDELLAPVRSNMFRGVTDYAGRLELSVEDGGVVLQHGIRSKERRPDQKREDVWPDYVIDVDVFRNLVLAKDFASTLDRMHGQAFEIFDWAIGPAAREYLTKEAEQ